MDSRSVQDEINDEAPLLRDHHESLAHLQPSVESVSLSAVLPVAASVLLAVFVVSFDISYCIANYSKLIASDLNELNNAAWIPLASIVSDASCQPLYGYFAKLYGRKRPLLTASFLLAAGLLLCGASQTLWQLALARVLVGMGASGVLLLAIIILTDFVQLAHLPWWRSFVVFVQSLALMSGSPLGSRLAARTSWSWHLPFLVEGVVAGLAGSILVLTLTFTSRRLPLNDTSPESHRPTFDIYGSVTLFLAVIVPLIALNIGGNILPWNHPAEILLLSLTPALFALYAYLEIFKIESPLLPKTILRSSAVWKILAITFLTVWARNQLDVHMPLYVDVQSTPKSSSSNWILTYQFLGVSVGSFFAGWLISRSRRFKWLLIVSTTLAFILYLNMALGKIKPEDPRAAPVLIAFGMALGALHQCLIVGMLSATPWKERPTSIAFFELVVAIAGAIGIAVSSALQRQWFISSMFRTFGASARTKELVNKSLASLKFVRGLPVETQTRVLECFAEALRIAFGASCILLIGGVIIGFFVQNSNCDHWFDAGSKSTGIREEY